MRCMGLGESLFRFISRKSIKSFEVAVVGSCIRSDQQSSSLLLLLTRYSTLHNLTELLYALHLFHQHSAFKAHLHTPLSRISSTLLLILLYAHKSPSYRPRTSSTNLLHLLKFPSPPSQTTSTIGSCSSKTSAIPSYTSSYISPFYITTHSPRHYLALILPNHVCWTITAIYILPTLPRHAR
jgi:hypothetical protein